MALEPYNRQQYMQALVANAAANPLNIGVLLAVGAGGMVLGAPWFVAVGFALVMYVLAGARTFFDSDEADKVLASERGVRAQAQDKPRLATATLAPPIAALVSDARRREDGVRKVIDQAELPYTEVSDEVTALVGVIESSASRAQMLYETLEETPADQVRRRLGEVKGVAGKEKLAEALTYQHRQLERMADQLQRFYDEMERMLVELDTIRGSIVSLSASTDTENQTQLAENVRALRDNVGAVADGMAEAYAPAS